MNKKMCFKNQSGVVLKSAALGVLLVCTSAQAVNVTKLDTASMAANTSNWSAAPGATDVGEFDATCSAGSMAALTLGGSDLTLGGLQFNNNMTGPATILSGSTLTLGTSGINMGSANQNVTINCGIGIGGSQAWNVGSGIALALGSGFTATALVVTKSGDGVLNVNGFVTCRSSGGSEGFRVIGGSAFATGIAIGRNSYANTVSTIGVPSSVAPTTTGFYVTGNTTLVSFTGASTISYIGNQNSGGTARIDDGTVTMAGPLILGKTTNTRVAIFQMNGGSFSSTNTLQIAPNNGVGMNTAVLYLTGGATTFEKIGFGSLTDTLGGNGYVTLAGGTLYLGSGGIVRNTPVGTYNSKICLNSGTLGAKSDWNTSLDATLNGTVTIQAADAEGIARNIILGGNISTTSGTGAIIKTGGGTLALAGNNSYVGSTRINAGTLQVGNGDASGNLSAADTIAITNNGTLAFKRSDSVTFPGAISGTGSLSQLGSGTLTLDGANTYSGGTTISAGKLLVNNTSGLGTGSVTVQDSGLLGGTGTVTVAVTVNAGGGLAPGNSVGSLTIGSLTLNSGATNSFEFSSTPANDQVVVTTSGGLILHDGTFGLYAEGGVIPLSTPGTYNLIQFSGSLSGTGTDGSGNLNSDWTTASESNPHIANPQTGYKYAFGTSGGWLTLTVQASVNNGIWNLNSDGNWSMAGNWTAVAGTMPPRAASDTATLGNSSALRTVTLDANESVGTLLFNNANSFVVADGGYTLTLDKEGNGATVTVMEGTANDIQSGISLNDDATVSVDSGKSLAVSGAMSNTGASKTLTLTGSGTTVLSGNNSYGPSAGSVGTTLSGDGLLQLGHNSALGAADVRLSGSYTIQSGTADLSVGNNFDIASSVIATLDNNGNDLTLGGVISGDGAVTKIGAGALSLGGANTYAGGTAINEGTVIVSNDGASSGSAADLGVVPASATPNNVILNGGALLSSGTLTLHANRGIGIGPVEGSVGATAFINAAIGETLTINGIVASAGNTGANGLTVNSGSGNTGTVVLGGVNAFKGVTIVSGGTLRLANALALQNSTLNYNNQGGMLSFGSLTAATLGNLSGEQDLAMVNDSAVAVALTVGGNNGSQTFSGVLSGDGSLRKSGTGTLTLTQSAYTGSTIAYNGGLIFTGPSNLTSHLDLSAQYGVVNATINGTTVTSPSGLYITSSTGSSGTIWGSLAILIITNGAQVVANPDSNGRAISYGVGNGRPGGNGSFTIGTPGDITTLVKANGALDMFYTSGGGTVGNFTVNLDGGTLEVKRIQETTYGSQSGTFKFNGGVLKALTNDTTAAFIPATPTQFTTVINAGGAIIDDNGCSITVAAALSHGTGTPDGGLTKLGNGTLTRANSATYTGPTTVSAGTMWVNGTHTTGTNYTVVTGATLGGTGTVSVVTGATIELQSNATLAPGSASGAAAGGTLTLNSLTLASTAQVVIDATNDQVVVTGDLTLNDNAVSITDPDILDRSVQYPVMSYTGVGTIGGTLATDTSSSRWKVRKTVNTFYLSYNNGTMLMFQ